MTEHSANDLDCYHRIQVSAENMRQATRRASSDLQSLEAVHSLLNDVEDQLNCIQDRESGYNDISAYYIYMLSVHAEILRSVAMGGDYESTRFVFDRMRMLYAAAYAVLADKEA